MWPVRLLWDWLYSRRAVAELPPGDLVITNSVFAPMHLRRQSTKGAIYVHVGRFPKRQVRWYRHAARLQAPSSPVAAAIAAIVPECASRIVTIPYPLPPGMAIAGEAEARSASQDRPKVIVYAGRIHPQKGIGLLIDAFARFGRTEIGREWRLRLVGPQEMALGGGGEAFVAALKERARDVSERIQWVGFLADPDELRKELRGAGAFVYPSIDEGGETFGVGPLEAMAQARPVVVSALECFGDFLRDGENGLVFDHRASDPAGALAARLTELASDPDRAAALGFAAWRTSTEYSAPSIAARFLADFEAILQVKRDVGLKP